MRCTRRALAVAGLTLITSTTIGCWAIHERNSDVDRTPVVNTGAGATIIRPGQAPPPHPGNYHPREAGYGQPVTAPSGAYPAGGAPPQGQAGAAGQPQAQPPAANPYGLPSSGVVAPGVMQPPPEYASGSTSGAASGHPGGGIRMLGGAETEITQHVTVNEAPRFLKYAALPFAVLAAPFKYGAEKLRGEPEAGPAVPRIEDQRRPQTAPPPPVDYESARLRDMERELSQRQPVAPPLPGAAPATGASIADELAALRRHAGAAPPAPTPAPVPAPAAAPTGSAQPVAVAPAIGVVSGQVDRNGDGRVDHWIERAGGAIARESFDENFDGRPDRTLYYDPVTHEVVRIEEDADHDGRLDTWTTLRGGQVVGRRVDGNGDGQVDSWSSYKDGVITRLERDANGDGFRDRVATYGAGRLLREERDEDGDGRTDLVQYYDDGERIARVEEDADGDGQLDVVSYYEDGRLTRREVLDASLLGLSRDTGATEHN